MLHDCASKHRLRVTVGIITEQLIQLLIHCFLAFFHLAKLSKPGCQKDVRKYFFSYRVINRWNALDEETVSFSSINVFRNRLNKIRMTRMGYFMDWFWLALGLPDALPWKATRGEVPRWDTCERSLVPTQSHPHSGKFGVQINDIKKLIVCFSFSPLYSQLVSNLFRYIIISDFVLVFHLHLLFSFSMF